MAKVCKCSKRMPSGPHYGPTVGKQDVLLTLPSGRIHVLPVSFAQQLGIDLGEPGPGEIWNSPGETR